MELSRTAEAHAAASGRRHLLIAESNLNDSIVIRPCEQHGYGFDAQWSDDLHHALHTLLTGERDGYYVDFGQPEQLALCLRRGAIFAGQFSKFRRRRHGNSPDGRPARQFVVFSQNHDQIGNRMHGERLCSLVGLEAAKLAAAVVLLSPYVPLLFMGEEYAEEAPFPFFVSHGHPDLVEAVRRGRREEFRSFTWSGEPRDPQSPETFTSAILQWDRRKEGHHAQMLQFYRELLRLRREHPALAHLEKTHTSVSWLVQDRVLAMDRWSAGAHLTAIMGLSDQEVSVRMPPGRWRLVLHSAETRWGGAATAVPGTLSENESLTIPAHAVVVVEKA